jgi:hypothetical protein
MKRLGWLGESGKYLDFMVLRIFAVLPPLA